jgi:hypothetical protein
MSRVMLRCEWYASTGARAIAEVFITFLSCRSDSKIRHRRCGDGESGDTTITAQQLHKLVNNIPVLSL